MTRQPYTPRPYAELADAHFRKRKRKALWAGMGMGKSVITLTHLDIRHNVWGEDAPTLILGPLRVAENVWPREVKKWQHLSGLDVVPIVGTAEERAAALRRDAPVKTINYDNLQWLRAQYPGSRWPFRLVVADESTRLKNFRLRGKGGVRASALGEVAHKHVDEFIQLTGTPSPNGLRDLWGQMWFLDEGEALGRTFSGFEERYFAWKRVRDALTHKPGVVQTILPHAHELIHEKLADLCLTLDPKDWFDLDDPIVNVIEVELPARARGIYKELERELFVRLGDDERVEVFNAAALTIKCLQLANGAVYLTPDGDQLEARGKEPKWSAVHDEKLDALESVVEEAGGAPVLAAYHFKSDLARIKARFPDAIDIATRDGLAAAQAGRGRLWLGHPASVGHGVDGLQDHCNQVVFFGHWWDLEQFDQLIERVGPVRQMQAGKDRPVFIHHIVAKDTIDEVVVARRNSKRGVQNALLDYMKGKR